MSDLNINDIGVAKMVIANGTVKFKDLSEELRNNEEIALYAINKDYNNYQYCGDKLKNDSTFNACAVIKEPYTIKYFSEDFIKNDKDFFKIFAKIKPEAFQYYPEDLKNNKDFCKYAINEYLDNFKYLSNELKNDNEIKQLAAEKIKNLFSLRSKYDKENITKFISNYPSVYEYLPNNYKDNGVIKATYEKAIKNQKSNLDDLINNAQSEVKDTKFTNKNDLER